jgi:hypothetical protein
MTSPPRIAALALILLGLFSSVSAAEPPAAEPAAVMTPLELAFWKYPPSEPLNDELYKRLSVRIAQVTKYGSNPATADPLWIVRLADRISDQLAGERLAVFLADVAARKHAQQAELARLAADQRAADELLAANPRVSPFGQTYRGLQTSYPLFDGGLSCASLGRQLRLGDVSLRRAPEPNAK